MVKCFCFFFTVKITGEYNLLSERLLKAKKMNDFPQKINVNDMAYKVIAFLGKGKGGYSYLVTDGKKNYTLKQIHHEPCNYYNFGNKLQSEINDYNTLIEIGILLPKMIDVDVSNERILK